MNSPARQNRTGFGVRSLQKFTDEWARDKIRPQVKEEAIASLLTQRNVDEAARVVGITTHALLRWMKVPEFQTAYREARRATFGQTIARLQQASSAVVTTLLKLAVDPNAAPAVRVRAAFYILKSGEAVD